MQITHRYRLRLIADPTLVPPLKYFTMGYFIAYPLARGSVHITSADDVNASLDFTAGFLEEYVSSTSQSMRP